MAVNTQCDGIRALKVKNSFYDLCIIIVTSINLELWFEMALYFEMKALGNIRIHN